MVYFFLLGGKTGRLVRHWRMLRDPAIFQRIPTFIKLQITMETGIKRQLYYSTCVADLHGFHRLIGVCIGHVIISHIDYLSAFNAPCPPAICQPRLNPIYTTRQVQATPNYSEFCKSMKQETGSLSCFIVTLRKSTVPLERALNIGYRSAKVA